ncbi:GNAT family N-acetyltransferase [Martelella alba]|uniref:GNAT family N-acetyltransferase n=1 Tax=Martelella alba TaxID=2590451 RepID=A0A506UJU5_9HYPH|nr:GNAT family N-acetyltransferase [Martelella alba]TPW33611.1 GNAT family N-acetyltransferase [Martelella alba]
MSGDNHDVPQLLTARIRMRGFRLDDFEDFAAMWADPVVVRYISGTPQPRSQSWERLLRHIGHWHALGFGYWAVEDRDSGAFIGGIGFAANRREITPSIDAWPEIGWTLVPAAHGRGLASEAVAAAIAWGDQYLEADRTVCIFDPQHAASIRVAEKNGYQEMAMGEYRGQPTLIMERRRP